ncbi:unnamed protein product [marine sediment metagenome]|uniref:Uncharacterized protein n=1 Tax=marine sediment metagenome TaxID=412755 RepID=X1I9H1_9ZZZZ
MKNPKHKHVIYFNLDRIMNLLNKIKYILIDINRNDTNDKKLFAR